MDLSNVFEKILGVYSLILASFGTIGNTLCVFICVRKSLRETSTFVIMACISAVDTMSLYFWNLNVFIKVYFGFLLQDINLNWW